MPNPKNRTAKMLLDKLAQSYWKRVENKEYFRDWEDLQKNLSTYETDMVVRHLEKLATISAKEIEKVRERDKFICELEKKELKKRLNNWKYLAEFNYKEKEELKSKHLKTAGRKKG